MRKTLIIVTAGATIASAQLALADMQYSGSLAGMFESATSAGATVHSYGGGGQFLVSFDQPGFNVQVSGAGATADTGTSTTMWFGDGDVFWRDPKGTFGASVSHASLSAGYLNAKVTSYGAFGEWYLLHDLTLRIKGGAFSGDASGEYGGAGAEYFPLRDFGLSADYTYVNTTGHSASVIGAGAEYLVSEDLPLSVRIGYDRASGYGATAETFSLQVKYSFGLSGSLIDWSHRGPISWNGALSGL
ncbi:MAG: hypothetical protein KGJ78_16365 [Alphaproteobacteria bacterium]|nr:hypothetical protein [Alphaproteobacteria bacterium]